MEMNQRATKLLFRDKRRALHPFDIATQTLALALALALALPLTRRALHLFDIATQTRSTLLSFSSYVQWVPDSDVVVAQSRSNLCVWCAT